MITFTQSDYRREPYLCSGWNISTDDDLPHQPECDELDSAQRKRYFRQTLCGAGGHQSAGCTSRIQSGRLGTAVTRVGRRIWIDPKVAAIEWAKHGRPCNSRAAQLEQLLTATAPKLASEVVGQSPEYCRAAIWRWLDDAINRTA